MEEFAYFDISPLLSEDTAVFPGDRPFSREVAMSIKEGHNIDLSAMESTVHIGAHTDAPCHYHKDGESMENRSLNYYYGPAQVISVDLPKGKRIEIIDLGQHEITAPRVLFKTNSFPNPNQWNSDFNSLSPELVNHLHKNKVRLVGIDTPSIDPEDDKELLSHTAVYNNDMAILEGIVLSEVPDGVYHLVALPLRLKGFDASPVRAILIR